MAERPFPASVVVLAGGDSRRMGREKALLKMSNGRTMVERVLSQAALLSEEVILVTNHPRRYGTLGVKVATDIWPAKGALGGIYTGLSLASYPHSLVVACDMPFLNLALLRYMLIMAPEYDVVVPRAEPWGAQEGDFLAGETARDRFLQPLHAVYSQRCLPPIRDLLEEGDLRVIAFYPQVRVRYVEKQEIEIFDPHHLSFFNINTPEDLEEAARIEEMLGEATPNDGG